MRTNQGRMFGKILSGSLVAGAILAVASTASALMTVDVRVTGSSGPGITVNDPHNVVVDLNALTPSSTLTMDIVGRVTGTNTTLTDEGMQSIQGGFHDVLTGVGVVTGNLTSLRWGGGGPAGGFDQADAFNTGSGLINPDGMQVTALNGKGGLDIFDGTTASQNNAFQARAGSILSTTGAPEEFKVGTLTFNNMVPIANGGNPGDVSTLQFTVRAAAGAGIWKVDTVSKTPSSDTVAIQGVAITTIPVPEPASMALLGLGALALVARPRRKA